MNYKIGTTLEQIKRNYDTNIQIVPGLFFRQKDIIKNIEFYGNSRYLNGQTDELGREKPFYNILNGICEVENAAKDIDTKDITATSDDGDHYVQSFLLTKDVYQWMKETNFAKTLNDMRDNHTRYGSLLVKKCYDADGSLKLELPEWKNVITDQVDIINNPIVEIHYMTATEIMDKSEWKNIQQAIENNKEDGKNKFNSRIPVYEVRGRFPLAFYKEIDGSTPSKKDEMTFSFQLYYLAGLASDEVDSQVSALNNSQFSDHLTPLYWENDIEQEYKYLARKRKSGRSFGTGVFEEGESAQVWTNDVVLKQQRAMEYTTKVVAQTASKKLKGRNMLTEVDDGQILEHEDGKPIEPITLLPSGGLSQYQNLIYQWFAQFEQATSAYAMQRGEVTTKNFRLQSLALQQSGAVFQDLQEDLGIFITEIFNDWIMPYLAKQFNKQHILAHDFSMEELKEIDHNFSVNTANQQAAEKLLSGELVTAEDYEAFLKSADDSIKKTQGKRFLDIPKNYYKDLQTKVTINVTGEAKNKAQALESLTNIMMIYVKNPAAVQDPVLMQLFMKIVELSGAGISPVTLMASIQEQAKKAQEQQGQPQDQPNPAVPSQAGLPSLQPSNLSLTARGGN
jgi:hypothetical protein